MQALRTTPLWRRLWPLLVAGFLYVAVLKDVVWPWLNVVFAITWIAFVVAEVRQWHSERR